MTPSKGSNINLVKTHNISAVLLSLLREGSLSRVELAERLSLSSTTITNLTSELLKQEIIVEYQNDNAQKRKRVGRPRRALRLVPSARFAVGVHIGVGVVRVAVTNLYAEIIYNQMIRFDLQIPAEIIIRDIVDLVRDTIDESEVDQSRIIGVGVGASGLVNNQTGVNVLAPRLGWENVPIRSLLESQLELPVCMDNNVRAMALGEAFFGEGRDVGILAFVYGRIGVGAGLVFNGQLFHGSGAGAGEIGHTIVIPQGGDLCTCGNYGCLETLLSEPVLVEQAIRIANDHPESILAQSLKTENETTPLERIFAAARAGDQATRAMIEERACFLGIALANLVNMLNPELILLGGMFAQAEELFIPTAEAKMRERSFGGLGKKVKVAPTNFGWRAGVVGASSLALTSFFYQQPEGI